MTPAILLFRSSDKQKASQPEEAISSVDTSTQGRSSKFSGSETGSSKIVSSKAVNSKAASSKMVSTASQSKATKQTITSSTTVTTSSTQSTSTVSFSFEMSYSLDSVSAKIKQEYIDYNKEYTAADFPELDVKSVDTINFQGPSVYAQYVFIDLNEAGEHEVRQAVALLSKNPIVESAEFESIQYSD